MANYEQSHRPSDGGPAIVVSFSIGSDRDDLIRSWERGTPSFQQRIEAITHLRRHGVIVVATLSPFGLWIDLSGAIQNFKEMGVAFVTVLFFKIGTRSANTPTQFLEPLRRDFPQVLDEDWQHDRLREIRAIYGTNRVIVGQAGFEFLAQPHFVGA
ncbi:MAG: hypothetical protein U1D55_07300 [Phycisphaerae bacterium]